METRTLICANAWENMKFLSNDPFFKKSQKSHSCENWQMSLFQENNWTDRNATEQERKSDRTITLGIGAKQI